MEALKKAIELLQGQAALATAIGVQQQHVWNWLKRGRVPAEHCPAIERATGVKCEELRPDVEWSVLRSPPKKAARAQASNKPRTHRDGPSNERSR